MIKETQPPRLKPIYRRLGDLLETLALTTGLTLGVLGFTGLVLEMVDSPQDPKMAKLDWRIFETGVELGCMSTSGSAYEACLPAEERMPKAAGWNSLQNGITSESAAFEIHGKLVIKGECSTITLDPNVSGGISTGNCK